MRWDPGSTAPELGEERAGTAGSSDSDSNSNSESSSGNGKMGVSQAGDSSTLKCPVAAFSPSLAALAVDANRSAQPEAVTNGGRPVRTVKPTQRFSPDYLVSTLSSSSSSVQSDVGDADAAAPKPAKRKRERAVSLRRSRGKISTRGDSSNAPQQAASASHRAAHASVPVTDTSTSTASDSDSYASTGTAVSSRLDRFLASAGDPQDEDALWSGILLNDTDSAAAPDGEESTAAVVARGDGGMMDDAALDQLVASCAEGLLDMGCDGGEPLAALLASAGLACTSGSD
jgi:hypothetical protein